MAKRGVKKAAGRSAGNTGGAAKSGRRKSAAQNKRAGARAAIAAPAKPSNKGKVATKLQASETSGATLYAPDRQNRSGGAVDAPGKKHRKPMPSETAATGLPRGQGARIATSKAAREMRRSSPKG